IPQNIQLADPQFNVSSEIDLLIGADHFWHLLCVGQIKSSPIQPILQKTRFGWILAGCVFKSSRGNDKIRVVFDASAKSSTGTSLYDMLMVGPTVQQRFRMFRFVLTADIVKMYRQVLVHPSQTRYQRILWRDNLTSDIKTYELVTLTYGTSSAPYLATGCFKWLADLHANKFPSGSACVGRDFYVDDMLTGADTIDKALIIRDQTIKVLRTGAFELSKWASNCPDLLNDIILAAPVSLVILDIFNSQHLILRFTMEVEGDRLNFLDVTVTRDNEVIKFDWYHKPTFHRLHEDHEFDWDDVRILDEEPHYEKKTDFGNDIQQETSTRT
ncbi:hypothetical protein ALC62_10437, partial [Cyphomyrmex costatus]